jgi:O-antigen ligase
MSKSLFVTPCHAADHKIDDIGPARIVSGRLASLALFAVIVLAPLPFGSTDPLPTLTWCCALGMALCTVSLRALDSRHLLIVAGVAVIAGAYLLVVHEQVAARPFFDAALPDPIWHAASDALGSPVPASMSMVRDQPVFALGAPLAAILCLLVSFIVCVDRQRAHRLLHVVAWSGSAYAAYGIAAFFIDPTMVLWMKKQAYLTVLTSTFINRNTAAAYFGACSIVWLLILLQDITRSLPSGAGGLSRSAIAQALRNLRDISLIRFLAFFACFIAMFLTGSRAGVLLSLLVGAIAVGGLAWKAVSLGGKHAWMLMPVGGILIGLIQLLGAGVIGRLDSEGLAGGGRLDTYRSTWAMIADHPWLGTGLGTFAWSYPSYRSGAWTSWGTWERAHSTPLEIVSDMGLPLAGLVVAGWTAIFGVLLFGLWSRQRDRIVLVAALAAASLGILHSMIDFSLQIPGFALMVFALVGAGLAQSFRITQSPRHAVMRSPSSSSRQPDISRSG